MKKPLIAAAAGLGLITVLLLVLWIYTSRSADSIEQQTAGQHTYERHYALISSDTSALWQSIYQGAAEAGVQNGDYVEWIGSDLPDRYTVEDYLRIAAAAKVDGILLRCENTPQMTQLIDEAAEQGIPVAAILEDDSASKRVSYVGLNSYEAGEFYGQQVLDCLRKGQNHVTVLVGSSVTTEDANFSILYSRMLQVIDQGKTDDSQVFFETRSVNTSSSFDVEESIRDLFAGSEETPDILICLDLTSTECALQVLVDRNAVGYVSLIGYYASETVLQSIQKGVMKATLGIDGARVGRMGVEALDEYLDLGNVSNYFNVSPELIDADNAAEYTAVIDASNAGDETETAQ